MKRIHVLLACTSLLLLAACGTTSGVRSADPQAGTALPDLSGYERVVVLDFTDATDKTRVKPEQLQVYTDSVATATRTFADLIAARLRESGAFTEISRTPVEGKALRITGRITRLTEGSAAKRLFIGLGAGSSYFDATTVLQDQQSGAVLGDIATDRNSWGMGGAIAASQNVQGFMDGAAKKIATDLATLKTGDARAPK